MPKDPSKKRETRDKHQTGSDKIREKLSNLTPESETENPAPESDVNKDKATYPNHNISHDTHPDQKDDVLVGEGGFEKEQTKHQEVPSTDRRTELEILMNDVRGSIKGKSLIDSESQVFPGSTYHKKKGLSKGIQTFKEWISDKFRKPYSNIGYKKKTSPVRIILIILFLAVIVYFLFQFGRPFFQISPTITPTQTQVPTYAIPEPFSVQFPGGWQFSLKSSRVPYPDWNPTQPEWLEGTQICKLIAIPWNIQIDAVYKTIVKGDAITLMLDNKDQYSYVVNKLETDSKDELIQKVNSPEPCLIIFLYKASAARWQVINSIPFSP